MKGRRISSTPRGKCRTGTRDVRRHHELRLARLCLTALVENQIPDAMKARNMPREQVINDVILAGQPTKPFVTADQIAALSEDATEITGANLSIDGGWAAA